jgi:uncharacterized membrane protein
MNKEKIGSTISIVLIVLIFFWVFNMWANPSLSPAWLIIAIIALMMAILSILIRGKEPTRKNKQLICGLTSILTVLSFIWFFLARSLMIGDSHMYWFQWSLIALVTFVLALIAAILDYMILQTAPGPSPKPKKFCSHCGKEVTPSAEFCDKCGQSLKGNLDQTTKPPQ